MATDFWRNPTFEPKRQFRFLVQLSLPDSQGGQQDVTFLAKSVDRPSYTISSNPHQFFNHTFYYPGRVTWNTISLTLVDPVTPNASELLYNYLAASGVQIPTSYGAATSTTITKASATRASSDLVIQEIATTSGTDVSKIVGEWRLLNSFFTDVNFGSHSYDSEDMVEVSVTVQYDWAEYNKSDSPQALDPRVES
tara:strand:+ start:486 stop:1070 length:585 start_codon:yes stop_codon:yes gene_type:complete